MRTSMSTSPVGRALLGIVTRAESKSHCKKVEMGVIAFEGTSDIIEVVRGVAVVGGFTETMFVTELVVIIVIAGVTELVVIIVIAGVTELGVKIVIAGVTDSLEVPLNEEDVEGVTETDLRALEEVDEEGESVPETLVLRLAEELGGLRDLVTLPLKEGVAEAV